LLAGNISDFGHRLHRHWLVKKRISPKMSSKNIDYSYKLALQNGALGGKIMGAGGGGLLLFCIEQGRRRDLMRVMEGHGMRHIDFKFEFEGVKILNT
jgi:D-glycero-alpha-D-manno-heptose-7-phosphate kinase